MDYLAHSGTFDYPPQSYKDHVTSVVDRSIETAKDIAFYMKNDGDIFINRVKNSSLMHDIGKLIEENQNGLKCGTLNKLPYPHSDMGTYHFIKNKNMTEALMVSSHHRGLPDIVDEVKENSNGTKPFLRHYDENIRKKIESSYESCLKIHNEEITKYKLENIDSKSLKDALSLRLTLSCVTEADHYDTALNCGDIEEYYSTEPIWKTADERIESLRKYVNVKFEKCKKDKNKERAENRQEVFDICLSSSKSDTGFGYLNGTVGIGKTTAGMVHALKIAKENKLRRIFVIAPYTSIIDQNVEVYRDSLVLDGEDREKTVAACHHSVGFMDKMKRVHNNQWKSPIINTTAVQFFETLHNHKTSSLSRLCMVPGSVIYIDECHSVLKPELWPIAFDTLYDLVNNYGCYVIMSSGTLIRFWESSRFVDSKKVKIKDIIKPILPKKVERKLLAAERKRVKYKIKRGNMNLFTLSKWLMEFNKPRLVVMNTIASAAYLAKHLAIDCGMGWDNIYHLSTDLSPHDRHGIIDSIKRRLIDDPEGNFILVATNCVECGVDISFPIGFREKSAVYYINQFSGRVNRDFELSSACVYIFSIKKDGFFTKNPDFEYGSKVYDEMYKIRKRPLHVSDCTEAFSKELRLRHSLGERLPENIDDNTLLNWNKKCMFPKVKNGDPDIEKSPKFSVINDDTVLALVNMDIVEGLINGNKIPIKKVLSHCVQIKYYYIEKYNLLKLFPTDKDESFDDEESTVLDRKELYREKQLGKLYIWTLKYDKNIGYMAGIIDLKESGGISSLIV